MWHLKWHAIVDVHVCFVEVYTPFFMENENGKNFGTHASIIYVGTKR